MRTLTIIISFIGLAMTIIPSFLVLIGEASMDQNKNFMLIGTLLWFGTVPFWMNKKKAI
jgi:hypothetical protein